jgi:hypothetical protein
MTIAEFKAYFTEFDSIADAQVQRALDVALLTSDETILGDKYNVGLMYLTAHYLVLNSSQFSGSTTSGNGNKSVNSKSVDGVSISYSESGSNMEAINGQLNSTSYGQVYQAMTIGLGSGGFTC